MIDTRFLGERNEYLDDRYSIRKLWLELSVFSVLESDERPECIVEDSTQSVQYLLLMDVFPSALSGCACLRVYLHASLVKGLI